MSERVTMSTRDAERRWTHAGLDCAAISSGIGFVNGYVRLPDNHFARHMGYDQINRAVSAHGGLTYGADADGWVGFDTGHAGDHWPGEDRYSIGRPAIVWTLDGLYDETERVAEQLAALTSLPDPESSWDCTDAEFRRLLRESKAWRRLKGSREAVAA